MERLEKKIKNIRIKIDALKAEEAKLMLQIRKEKDKLTSTTEYKGLKRSWKHLKTIHRSTLYRRKKKLAA